MAEVAGIGTPGGKFICRSGTAHLVTPNRGQNAVRRMRHVAVMTFGAAGLRARVRMRDYCGGVSKTFMALRACLVVGAVPGELIVWVAIVQGMAGKA